MGFAPARSFLARYRVEIKKNYNQNYTIRAGLINFKIEDLINSEINFD